MKNRKSMTKGRAWFLLIAGLILGTVFTVGMPHWNAPITREDAISATAVYQSYEEARGRNGRIKEIVIRFADHSQLYIDGECITGELRDSIRCLAPGAVLSLTVHPNSGTIMELQAGDSVLLEFQNTSKKLTREAAGFVVLGLLCYGMSAYGLITLLKSKR